MTLASREGLAEAARRNSDDDAIEAAASWMARLLADDVTEQDRIDCQRWRDEDPRHEHAWQRMCQVSGKFAAVPAGTGGTQALEQARRAVMSRRRFLKLSAFAGVGVTATWLGASHTRFGRGLMAQYQTGVGETRSFTLGDGTRLVLNTGTAVDVVFSSRQRRIQRHHGEMLVTTGPESPRRDFVVDTRFGQLLALGTEFSLRQFKQHTRVAVLHGAVEAHPARSSSSQRVNAGQQTRLDSSRVGPPAPLQSAAVAWRQGKLVARGMRVAEFIEEIGRYRPGFTRYDPAVADLTISGVFSTRDTDRALQSLADSLPVELSYRTAYWVKVVPAR